MDYHLLINEEDTIISEDRTTVLLGWLEQSENTLHLFATTAKAWRHIVVPVVQYVTKKKEENPEYPLTVKVMNNHLNRFQEEFLEKNRIELEKVSDNPDMYHIGPDGMICLNGEFFAQIEDDRIVRNDG